jgi:hypothetical protein
MSDGIDKEHSQDGCAADSSTGFPPVKEFRIYKRNLPHREQPESIFLLLLEPAIKSGIVENIEDYKWIYINRRLI